MIRNRIGRAILALALLAVAAWGMTAQAALEVVEEAWELSADQVLRWPLRAGDRLVIQPCETCDTSALQVTEDTRYSTGFRAPDMSLQDLLREKSRQGGRSDYLVILFYTPDEQQVTRIILQTER